LRRIGHRTTQPALKVGKLECLDPNGLGRVSITYLIYAVSGVYSAGAAVAAAAADKGQDEQEKQPSCHRNYPVMQHALKKSSAFKFFLLFYSYSSLTEIMLCILQAFHRCSLMSSLLFIFFQRNLES
jgi:hypothetical protein